MNDRPQRRTLWFESIDQAVAEAERLAADEVITTGNFTYGQILEHLARAMDTVTGEVKPFPVALPFRIGGRLLRPLLSRWPLRPGFKLPKHTQSLLWPDDATPVDQGLQRFKAAVSRFQERQELLPHPVFGRMTHQQHEQIQCRHAELHLSFVHPRGAGR